MDELIVVSKTDLDACEKDRQAYLYLSVLLCNRLLRVDPDFKSSYEYDKAKEALRLDAKAV